MPGANVTCGPAGLSREGAFIDPPGYARHQPEETLLYQLVGR